MANHIVLGQSDRYAVYKSNSGGIRFQMKTAGPSPEVTLVARRDLEINLYKIAFGQETFIYNMCNSHVAKFTSRSISDFNELREYYITWYNNKIKVGVIGQEAYAYCQKTSTDPLVGYILFKTDCKGWPVEWIIETSPVILKSISYKKFSEGLLWRSMKNGKLPHNAMIGGFENEPIYVARARHYSSLLPGKYVPTTGKAFVPWGRQEHAKEEFEILCGYNAKWVPTNPHYFPHNAYIGGFSEINEEPLYIGRAMVNGSLVCGKIHFYYKVCFLPFQGREVEVTKFDILIIPDDEMPYALPLPFF